MSHISGLDFLSPQDGFLGLSDEAAVSPETARAWVIPFGLEASVSYGGGTSLGPQAILDASHQVELFDESFWCEPYAQYGVATLTPVEPKPSLEEALDQLAGLVKTAVQHNKFPMILGGEHALTPGAIRPFVEDGDPLTILQFDAHADLRDGYEGEHYSHASAMRRCLDYENVRVISVGVRNISAEEMPFFDANQHRMEIFWAKDLNQSTPSHVAKAVGVGRVYISFDVDGFDSSLMSATGTPEPGGLFWWDAIRCLEAVSSSGAMIVGADIVELAPQAGLHACDFLTAKMTYKLLSHALVKKSSA